MIAGRNYCALLLLINLLAGCAHFSGPENAIATVLARPMNTQQQQCLAQYQRLAQQAERQQLVDPVYQKITGLPFLRSDRLLASFADEINRPEQYRDWLQRLNNNAQQALLIEWYRLKLKSQASGFDYHDRDNQVRDSQVYDSQIELATSLQKCSGPLLDWLLEQPKSDQLALRAASGVSSLYYFWSRSLGRLMAPGLRRAVAREHQQQHAQQAGGQAMPALERISKSHRIYSSNTGTSAVASLMPQLSYDSLGLPILKSTQPLGRVNRESNWQQALLNHHSPYWAIDSVADNDIPGAPQVQANSVEVDTEQKHQYRYISYGRWQGEVVLQLNYVIWFSERRPQESLDWYAGKLDGLQWRVHLNKSGQVLAYDTIHNCGCWYQLYLNPRYAKARPQQSEAEPVFVSRLWPGEAAPLLLLQANTHFLIKPLAVDSAATLAARVEPLSDRPYQDLRRTSLFDADGIIPQSSRAERYFLWPAGVPNPGAMRLRNKHIIAFVGERYFDQAFLLQSLADKVLSD